MENSGSSPLAFGLEAYEYNGSTHLVIPIAYDDTAYEYNASMLSFDISRSSIDYVSIGVGTPQQMISLL